MVGRRARDGATLTETPRMCSKGARWTLIEKVDPSCDDLKIWAVSKVGAEKRFLSGRKLCEEHVA